MFLLTLQLLNASEYFCVIIRYITNTCIVIIKLLFTIHTFKQLDGSSVEHLCHPQMLCQNNKSRQKLRQIFFGRATHTLTFRPY